jgi:4-amino-4-deoxy-L-arabinose transferase-like glycosyltransferase
MITTTTIQPAESTLRPALRLAATFAAVKLILTFALTLYTQHIGYGYFRDEFYYIACGRHLAWGYVDQGPVVALQARLGELLFGDSLFAIRIFSAAAGAVMIFLAGLVAWALGGRRPAQALAMFGLICCPQFIGTDGFLSMNSCEPMFWMTCVLALLLMLRGASQKLWWTIFGVAAGIGLLNKPSMTFFLIAIGAGLLLTPQRRILFSRYAALGIALLILIALPNLLWQVDNHWPTLEFLRNGQIEHKNVILNPLQFFLAQFRNMQPMNALLWITGLVALLRAKSIRNTRWLGVAFVCFYILMDALHAKDYYLAGFYPALFAAGAIAWEHRFAASRLVREERIVAFPVFETILLVTTLIILPMASPILRPDTWVRYTTALHLRSGKTENAATSDLPQFYADRFGWQEMADQVVAAYRSLSPADRAQVCIVGDNYGDAGAIDFLGHRAEPQLPPAISHHNNYWIWGLHGCTGKVVIDVTSADASDVHGYYDTVQLIASLDVPHSMPQEHKNIYLVRGRKPEHPITWKKNFN